ncbi:hypothetical protein [Haloferula sargassicola]|uniref:Uncharacterized protein n=1 Tax=Haloferula sargassicola TaxID=490096 RepID=A0ABP9UPE7_9BACT
MKKLILAAATVAALAAPQAFAGDCQPVIERIASVASRAKVDPIELLKLVDAEVTAQPGCCCEIVKAAILGTECDDSIVGYVVETAIQAAPDQMRLIAQCAIATAPGSLDHVQEVLARLDPGAGEAYSAKDAKDAKVEVKPAAKLPDPLDVPIIIIPPIPPVIVPPPSTYPDYRYDCP